MLFCFKLRSKERRRPRHERFKRCLHMKESISRHTSKDT